MVCSLFPGPLGKQNDYKWGVLRVNAPLERDIEEAMPELLVQKASACSIGDLRLEEYHELRASGPQRLCAQIAASP